MTVLHQRKMGVALATVLLATVTACSSESQQETANETTPVADASGGIVNVYSARHYDVDNALYESFTAQTLNSGMYSVSVIRVSSWANTA